MGQTEFEGAVAQARQGRELAAGGVTRRVVDVSAIPGASELPACLVTLLENVVRRAATDADAMREAARGLGSAQAASALADQVESVAWA